MAIPPNAFPIAAGLALAALVLYLNLWRAVLFVAPSTLRLEIDAPADQVTLPQPLQALAAELTALGFAALGTHLEAPRLRRPTLSYDFAHAGERTFATLYLGRDSGARLYLLTPLANGGFVITANYRRPARDLDGRYRSGGLEGASVERLFHAHQRRMEGLAASGTWTPEGRVEAGRAWFKGPGKTEVRAQNIHGLLWSAATVAMVIAAMWGRG